MTIRAAILGILLGLLIAGFYNYNTRVIHGVYLIGTQLPSGVFGVAMLLLLVWNPLAKRIRKAWTLKPVEVALITALGLAVCGWPGSNFMRFVTSVMALPAHLIKTKASWQTAEVMSYVPGASGRLPVGHVKDWKGLATGLVTAGSDPASPRAAARLWEFLTEEQQGIVRRLADGSAPAQQDKTALLAGINSAISRGDFYDSNYFGAAAKAPPDGPALQGRDLERFNRALIDAAFPDELVPLPDGGSVLVDRGQANPVAVDMLIQGSDTPLGLFDLPWRIWWPTLSIWLGVALCLAIAALCMAFIVHPQWSKRELLPYPIARFLREVAEQPEGGGWPLVTKSKLFWLGLGAVAIVHLVNGLGAWFPSFITIRMVYDFSPLIQLFPDTAKVPLMDGIYRPRIFPTVIAFAFFLSLQVSFSMGIMGVLFLAVGGLLVANGVAITSQGMYSGNFSMMVFGAFLATGGTVLFIGRRYYLGVVGGTFGLKTDASVPAYAVRACRGLFLCVGVAVAIMIRAGLDWTLSIAAIGLILLIFMTVSRIYAESGALLVQTAWGPAALLLGLFGVEAIGPTAYLVISMLGLLVVTDTRETWMAFFTHGLHMTGDSSSGAPPRRLGSLLLFTLLAGLAVALGSSLLIQYNLGIDHGDRWGVDWAPSGPYNTVTSMISELSAHNQLAVSTSLGPLGRILAFDPMPGTLLWIGIGMALVIGCTVARLRLPWWPLHPVIFLIWGTWAGCAVTFSFFLGWLIKLGVVKLAGAKSYQTVKPLMVGVIAGEILSALFWVAVSIIYYASTGLAPTSPQIFP